MKIHYKGSIYPTYFGHLCGHPKGGALRRINTYTEVSQKLVNQCTDVKYLFKYMSNFVIFEFIYSW